MIELTLVTTSTAHERIKEYLEQNVSEVLADKINNGVKIEKDGKTLINKKTLDGFMTYACSEAQKIAEKGARGACVEDSVVFGWAIHYFEEDSIVGVLYNEDGTEYKAAPQKKAPTKKIKPTEKPTPKTTEKPVEKTAEKPAEKPVEAQMSLFDFFK